MLEFKLKTLLVKNVLIKKWDYYKKKYIQASIMVVNDEEHMNITVQSDENIEYESALKKLNENSGLRRNRPGTSNKVNEIVLK